MNELEVTVWSIWLDKLSWEMQNLSLDNFILVTAMQTKEHLNDENMIRIHLEKLKEEFPNIELIYNTWNKEEAHRLDTNLIDINNLYRKFRQVNRSY